MSTLLHDVRYGMRVLMRSPVVTGVAALSLGLGVGANTAIFSLINEVFLQSLPMKEPARLMTVFTTDERNRNAGGVGGLMPTSRLNFEDYRAQNQVFDGMAAWTFAPLALSGGRGEPEQVFGQIVTSNYFNLLGAPMASGRGLASEDDGALGASPVVVLSYGLWQRRFGGDSTMVGQAIEVNGRSFTVVGVTAEGFNGTNAIGGPEMWVPFSMYRETTTGFIRDNWDSRRTLLFGMAGRLKPGVTVEAAQANLGAIGSALAQEYAVENRGRNVAVVPVADSALGANPQQRQNFTTAGALLMVIVGVVLLIACANVANLLLARASARRQEIAVRLSLGASRGRLIRQLLVESVLLGLVGGVAGLVIALWARSALLAMRPPFLPDNALSMPLDGPVLAFTTVIAMGTGLLFGLVPAWQFSRPDLVTELKDRSSQPSVSRQRFSIRNTLVVGQVALSLIALIGAGLFLRSLDNARQIDTGFDPARLAVFSFDLATRGMGLEAAVDRQRDLLERARSIPGVERAAIANAAPMFGGGFARSVFLEGQDATDARAGRFVQITAIGEGYFESTGIPLLRGRDFGANELPEAPQVVIINETMAKRFWPEQDALGKRFRFFGREALVEVVGIARDSKYNFIGEEPQPYIYQSLRQVPQTGVTVILRSRTPESTLGSVRAAIQQMEPQMPLTAVFTMNAIFDQGLWAARMGALLLAVFGLLALLLASIGVYGVMAYSVSQRTREIGVRLALGATAGEVRGLVFKQGLVLTFAGILVGIVAAAFAAGYVEQLLFDVNGIDPVTFIAIPAILIVVAALAIYIPARRASRVDPIVALRS